MKRRRVLAGVGVASLVGLSGCTIPFTDQGTKLLGVELINRSGEQQTIEVQVIRGTENIVYSDTHAIDIDGSVSLDCTWTMDPGEFTITLENESGGTGFVYAAPRCTYLTIEVQPDLNDMSSDHVAVDDNCERESDCR